MKVCFITANYPPEALGGTEQLVVALLRELRGLGVDPFVISGSDRWETESASDVDSECHQGVTVYRLRQRPGDHNGHGFVRDRALTVIRRLLAERRPEVVHVHAFSRLGTGITPICRRYLQPLIAGEAYPPYQDGLPAYVRLKATRVRRKLKTDFVI